MHGDVWNMTNERKNITQPSDWWDAFEAASDAGGVSLAEWIGEVCRQRLPASVREQLSERRGPGRPRKNKKKD